MKLGFISAILDQMSFEEMIDTAAGLGFSCVEVACWPRGKAERRYAGVSHIDIGALTDKETARILDHCKARRVEISSLAYYPNTMDGNPEKRAANIAHLKQVIAASHRLGVNLVTTFVGRDQKIWSCSRRFGRRLYRRRKRSAFASPLKTARCSLGRISGPAGRIWPAHRRSGASCSR